MAATKQQEKKDEQQVAKQQVANPELEQPRANKALDEVREVHAQQREKWTRHNRTEIEHEVLGVEDEDGNKGVLSFRSVGGRVYLSCSVKEVVLDHDGVADLQRKAQQAFQAVS